jgi:hypothetical protein
MLGSATAQGAVRSLPKSGSNVPRRRQPRKAEPYAAGGIEPALEDLLNDPVTTAMMRRDGVSMSSLRSLISETRLGLRSRTHTY